MKKWLFLLTVFILFKPVFPIVEYVVNYDYISKELCVNKETPILGCDGKCYLMSQLGKYADTEKPISDKKEIIKELSLLFFQEIKSIGLFQVCFIQKTELKSSYSNLYQYLNSSSVFHPPLYIS